MATTDTAREQVVPDVADAGPTPKVSTIYQVLPLAQLDRRRLEELAVEVGVPLKGRRRTAAGKSGLASDIIEAVASQPQLRDRLDWRLDGTDVLLPLGRLSAAELRGLAEQAGMEVARVESLLPPGRKPTADGRARLIEEMETLIAAAPEKVEHLGLRIDPVHGTVPAGKAPDDRADATEPVPLMPAEVLVPDESTEKYRPVDGETAWSWAVRVVGLRVETPDDVTDEDVGVLLTQMGVLAIHGAARAILVGNVLRARKAALPHGQWGTWVKRQPGLSTRSASRYMRLARLADEQIGQIWPICGPGMSMGQLEDLLVKADAGAGRTDESSAIVSEAESSKDSGAEPATGSRQDSEAVEGGDESEAQEPVGDGQRHDDAVEAPEADKGQGNDGPESDDGELPSTEAGTIEVDKDGEPEPADGPAGEPVETEPSADADARPEGDQAENEETDVPLDGQPGVDERPAAPSPKVAFGVLVDFVRACRQANARKLVRRLADEADLDIWTADADPMTNLEVLGEHVRHNLERVAQVDHEAACCWLTAHIGELGEVLDGHRPLDDADE